MVQIKDEHIKQAQDIFIDGNSFDDIERIPFIKNLETSDLLAVPGSGKTTALMAKLYCITQNMPFEDGSGILVLAHTNQAVEEIEKKLKKHCPRLFEYPNFIGTIQSFTNRFLANQACFENYGSYIRKNDDEMYENEVNKFYYSLTWSKKGVEPKNLINKLFGLVNTGKTVDFENGRKNIHDFLKKFEYNIVERKITYNGQTKLKNNTANQAYYDELENWKKELYKSGLLNYKDSFNLGAWILNQKPIIKTILQERFKYVFIDEMQDLEKFQIDLIDTIFISDNSKTIIQRIGDINQSIYNSGKSIKDNCDWVPRNQIYLTGSNRLTEEVANFVNYYTLDPQPDEDGNKRFVVKGLAKIDNPIQPHLIIFNKSSKDKLQGKFEQLIKDYNLYETSSGKKHGFHIISWSTEWINEEQNADNEKIRLKDIFPNYSRESKQKKEDFNCLRKHLQLFDSDKKTLEGVRKSILNALIRILREEKIYKNVESNIYFRKRDLIDFIKSLGNEKYEDFKLKLFNWCFKIIAKKEYEEVYTQIKEYVGNEFINYNWHNDEINVPRKIDKSTGFLNGSFIYLPVEEDENEVIENNEIKIKTSSVHAVKGQTHCATMYIESSYFNYETEKVKVVSKKATTTKAEQVLPNPLFNEYHSYRVGKDSRAKEALKMMYVGFSRPTHLLCFAALEENVKDDIEKYKTAGWLVIDDLINGK
ncbi:UvrD-helicase domain-containing protein [Flavobacterium undicola]|uniref:UvrD-helicase domain-containing protein n=1 Tax=Flavobacterium undicola TaxID=1932779 RepID=UPI0015E2341C|nr:UvrD-helicase domain-containing protein [Flavobacterium undicola]MBA0885140.1 UvrD-helicase domain-containing protein [Flavobacterium undicola]